MLLATFLSCKCFSYELLDFLGMATRESRHAIFVSYRLLNFLKTCAPIWNLLKASSYPYFRHGNAVYTNNLEDFVQKIFSISKNLCTFAAAVELKFHQFK